MQLNDEKKTVASFEKEFNKLEKDKSRKVQELDELKLELQQLCIEESSGGATMKKLESEIKSFLNAHPWIENQKQFVNLMQIIRNPWWKI
jgi:chromosome segregation ATPase